MHRVRGAGWRRRFWAAAWLWLGFWHAPSALPHAIAQGSDPVQDCLHAARVTQLAQREATVLCRSARSPGPALCFKAGRERTSLSDPQLLALCRCAEADSPIDCYEHAPREPDLGFPALLRRCSAIAALHLAANCRTPND